jgi:geranylgeranyl pyrophosphate synthase
LELKEIYRPIQGDLDLVEEELRTLSRKEFPRLAPLLEHILPQTGKRLRPALTLLAGRLYAKNADRLIAMAMAAELFHTATLVHDDVVDDSGVRRGRPTVHSLWGKGAALLLGDYLFSLSADLVASTRNMRVIDIFADTLKTVSRGELGHNLSPGEERATRRAYYRWIEAKTASVMAAATQAGGILGGAPEAGVTALGKYGQRFGLAFQVVDDILDFTGEEGELGKPVGSDLFQGALTLPVLILLERDPKSPLARGEESREKARRTARHISHSPVIKECYTIARRFSSQALRALEPLPPSPARNSLAALVQYNLERRK